VVLVGLVSVVMLTHHTKCGSASMTGVAATHQRRHGPLSRAVITGCYYGLLPLGRYGGRDHTVTDNILSDSVSSGGALHVGNRFTSYPLVGVRVCTCAWVW
jgi:hypothetical protein